MHDSDHDDVNGPMRAQWRWFLLPSVVISGLLLIASQAVFLQFSFYRDRGFGRTTPDFTFANYVRFFTDSFYLDSLRLTAEVALIVVICSMLVGYPCAYILARMRSRWATILLAGIVVTALVTEVIKVLGLLIIFRADGFLNRALMTVGLVAKPVDIIGTVPGVVVGLLHFTLGFVLLLMFSVIQTIPRSLEDAARIAGASRWRAFWRVVFPLSLPGVIAGSLVIFNLSMGAFTAAALLGGGRVLTLPVLIQRTIVMETKYAMAATLSAVLLLVVMLINVASVVVLARLQARRLGAVA